MGTGTLARVTGTISLAEKALSAAPTRSTAGAVTLDGVRLVDPVDLGGSTRSCVLRCRVEVATAEPGPRR